MWTWLFTNKAVFIAIVYVIELLVLAAGNKREFKRCPEKGERYKALPLRYKCACWFFVLPLSAGILIEGALFIPALHSFFLVESACIRWYRKTGLL